MLDALDPLLLSLLISHVPAGTTGEPHHIAALVLHLCSDEAPYTTG